MVQADKHAFVVGARLFKLLSFLVVKCRAVFDLPHPVDFRLYFKSHIPAFLLKY